MCYYRIEREEKRGEKGGGMLFKRDSSQRGQGGTNLRDFQQFREHGRRKKRKKKRKINPSLNLNKNFFVGNQLLLSFLPRILFNSRPLPSAKNKRGEGRLMRGGFGGPSPKDKRSPVHPLQGIQFLSTYPFSSLLSFSLSSFLLPLFPTLRSVDC